MESKKNLLVDAAICDVHNLREETLAAYGRVSIDSAILITSPEAQALLGRYQAAVDAAQIINTHEDIRVSIVNGQAKIAPSQTPPAEKTLLMLNGKLDIEPGSEVALKSYAGMVINGTVDMPESMTGLLSGVTVNGTVNTYPDGCIRLKSTTVLDRTFPLRARQDALYYAASRIIALSGDIDFGKLAEKNVRFSTKKLLIAEGLVEAALPLFDERTDIQILPDGCAYLDDDAELTEALVRRHGGKLYIDGDLTLLEDGPWLDQVTYLRADGDVLVAKDLEERLNALNADYDSLYAVGGTLLTGRHNACLSREALEGAERGISFVSCANVTVDEDVPSNLIRERLVSIVACANVTCTEEQRAAIEPLAQDVAHIGPKKEKQKKEEDPNTVKIDAAFYTL